MIRFGQVMSFLELLGEFEVLGRHLAAPGTDLSFAWYARGQQRVDAEGLGGELADLLDGGGEIIGAHQGCSQDTKSTGVGDGSGKLRPRGFSHPCQDDGVFDVEDVAEDGLEYRSGHKFVPSLFTDEFAGRFATNITEKLLPATTGTCCRLTGVAAIPITINSRQPFAGRRERKNGE